MVCRRLSTDIGLALLLASPFLLPAAPSPHSEQSRAATVAAHTVTALAQHSDRVRFAS